MPEHSEIYARVMQYISNVLWHIHDMKKVILKRFPLCMETMDTYARSPLKILAYLNYGVRQHG